MKKFKVKNMNCASCATMIELDLEESGINAKCSYAKETLEIHNSDFDKDKVVQILKASGYELVSE